MSCQPTDADIQLVGWCPGFYSILCHTCNKQDIAHKRCIICRDCAAEKWQSRASAVQTKENFDARFVIQSCNNQQHEPEQGWKELAKIAAERCLGLEEKLASINRKIQALIDG